jgi:uncharacterized protein
MKKAVLLALGSLVAIFAAQFPADARSAPDAQLALQFKKGMAAFNRHDYTAAGQLLRSPAEQGNAGAQAVLCFLHTHGRGVPQNYRTAASWCHRSADQGNPQGQYLLGLLYNVGHGVPENYVQAYKWLNLAAANATGPKRDFSYRIRDAVATKMSPAQVAKAQALSTAWRPVPEWHGAALTAEPCAGDPQCLER